MFNFTMIKLNNSMKLMFSYLNNNMMFLKYLPLSLMKIMLVSALMIMNI